MKSRYKKPNFPDRQDILDHLTASRQPRTLRNIVDALFIKSNKQQRVLLKYIRTMQRDDQIIIDDGAYRLAEKNDLYHGTAIGHPDGYGFFVIENKSDDLPLIT